MSRTERALARRYARALFAVASEEGTGTARRLKQDLRALAAVVAGHRELRAALEDPRVRPESRLAVLEGVAEAMSLPVLLRRLLSLLAQQDSILLLPALADAYREEFNTRAGIVAAEATGAVSLTKGQQRALAAALARVCGCAVELETRVEPELIGGLRVKMGDVSYDGTVRAHLAALRLRLAGGR